MDLPFLIISLGVVALIALATATCAVLGVAVAETFSDRVRKFKTWLRKGVTA